MSRRDEENWEADPVPEFLKDPHVAPRSSSTNDMLRQLLNEQREANRLAKETNRMLGKIGVMLQTALAKSSRAQTQAPTTTHGSGPAVDLDSEKGNFRVNKDPPKWSAENSKWDGASYAGKLLSECSPEFLDELAGFYEWRVWKAKQALEKTPDDKKAQGTVKYTPLDIARIQGWAQRLRNGYGGGGPQQAEPRSEGRAHEPDVPTL